MHHGRFSNNRLELVYTKYEVKRSIIKEDGCIQPFRAQNPVFSTLNLEERCDVSQNLFQHHRMCFGSDLSRGSATTDIVVAGTP